MDLSSNSNCPPTPPHLSACPATPTRPNVFKSNTASPAPTEDSSNDGRLSTASENGDNRASPPPNCAICLYKCTNKCFTDSCLHQFCFTCLLQWSKVKPECPLCKQSFKSIIHNVRSNDDYEEYLVRPTITTIAEPLLVSSYHLPHAERIGPRYRFRTTFNLQRRQEMALQNYFMEHPLTNNIVLSTHPLYDMAIPQPRRTSVRRNRHRDLSFPNSDFRAVVYRNNLWATPLPDVTGRFRECSAAFYRNNPAQKHRLFPWLDRELKVLLNQNQPHINYVMSIISNLLTTHDITSPTFRSTVQAYFTNNTNHFIHEFYQFARSPFDMVGYDRDVQYTSHEYYMETMPSVISSTTDTDDSDVRIVSPDITQARGLNSNNDDSVIYVNDESTPVMTSETTGLDLSYPRNNQIDSLISIETVSPTSSDDSDDCIITGVVKPPEERTPELVTLNSDNDTDVLSVHSEATLSNASKSSHSSGELYTPAAGIPSTSKAWGPKRLKTLTNFQKHRSPKLSDSSTDTESESDLPLIVHQRPMSEILLNRFKSVESNPDINKTASSSNEENKPVRKKANARKGKSLVRNLAVRKRSSSKRFSGKRKRANCSSESNQESSDDDFSSTESKIRLKSVVIKKTEDGDSINNIFEHSDVFNESAEGFNYTVGSSYYNNPITQFLDTRTSLSGDGIDNIEPPQVEFTESPCPNDTWG